MIRRHPIKRTGRQVFARRQVATWIGGAIAIAAGTALLIHGAGIHAPFWPQGSSGAGAFDSSGAASLTTPAVFVGGATCASCHLAEADQWSGSHHDRAMQD